MQGGPKIGTIFVRLHFTKYQPIFKIISLSESGKKFVIKLTKVPPHLKCVAKLPCEMPNVLKATTENKTTSVTTHFKKLTTENNVFNVSAIV